MPFLPPIPLIPLILLAVLLFAPANVRAEDWSLCPPMPGLPDTRLSGAAEAGATDAIADDIAVEGTTHILTGNVELRQGERWIGADRIEIDRNEQIAHGEGNVYLRTNEYAVFSPRGEIDMESGTFSVENPRLLYPDFHGQGSATRVSRDEAGIARLSGGSWSTCPADDEIWHLSAAEIELNPNNRQGTARHASLWFAGVPLMYTPWFRFPIGDDRLTGFLPPRVGSSSDSGTEITVPWYWNIAPNFDATLTPRLLSKRGTQLQTETRWLGDAGFWQLDLHHLPDDDEFGDDRTLGQLQQNGRFAYGLRTDVDLAGVSDDEYFDDLDDSLSLGSKTHLQSRADVFWNSYYGNSRLRLQSFRTLDDTIIAQNRPYKQLPQLTHRWRHDPLGYTAAIDAELVRFDRDDSVTGNRFRLVPAYTHEMETPGWFLRPRLAWDYTAYELDRVTSTEPERIERSLPVVSLDSGLVFERFGEQYRQTLEPRAFYVYVPDEDQDDIPLFDTGELGFSFSQLFRERRFSGGDRVGDTNRLSLALTSRLFSRTSGAEVLRGSIGAIHHFDDREVTLLGTEPETEELSDVVAEISARPNEYWRATSTAQWDPDAEQTQRHDSRVMFRGTGGGVANFGYRFQDDRREQVDAAFAWPINPRWKLLARSNYSLREERQIENLLGAEYESCCWRLRTVAREHIDQTSNNEVETDQEIYIELVLKGLGGFGDNAGDLFENAILGYRKPSDQTQR